LIRRRSPNRSYSPAAWVRSHATLELLGARFRVEFADSPRRRALDRLIDRHHRVLRRAEALVREVSLCDVCEETAW
jgi:hypothetical protein